MVGAGVWVGGADVLSLATREFLPSLVTFGLPFTSV